MEKLNVFLSHKVDSDRAWARRIAFLLGKAALGKIEPWYCSDPSADGGMQSGAWFQNLYYCMMKADIVVPLISSESLMAPWLLLETGFIAGLSAARRDDGRVFANVLPLCEKTGLVPAGHPLKETMIYYLDDGQSFQRWLGQLIRAAEMVPNTDMMKFAIERFYLASEKELVTDKRETDLPGSLQAYTELPEPLQADVGKKAGLDFSQVDREEPPSVG